MPNDVLTIVRERLLSDGLDGLCHDDGRCACLVDDLAPCGDIGGGCLAGRRVPCDGTCDDGRCDFHIVAPRDGETP